MKKVIIFAILFAPTAIIASEIECRAGDRCSLSGVLRIWRTPPAFTSALDVEGVCIPLALPKSVYRNYEKWEDKAVQIIGKAHAHHATEGSVYYTINGRNVTAAVCGSSKVALFVTDLKLQK